MPKISFLIAITLTALLGLSACNTVQGVGKDIQSIGKTTEEAADQIVTFASLTSWAYVTQKFLADKIIEGDACMTLLRLIITTVAFGCLLGLAGCNTLEGIGKDMQGAGKRIEDAAD